MRKFLTILLILLSSLAMGQKDTTLTIRVSSIREFPQIGLDLKGRKYFVMSTNQDRAALIALRQGLYADSILTKYDELSRSCDSTIALLRGRVIDRGRTIDSQVITIRQLEFQVQDVMKQRDNNKNSVDLLEKQVKKQKLVMWIEGAAVVIVGIIILDKVTDD